MEAKDFYFQLTHRELKNFFLITPIEVYNKDGVLSEESGVADEVLPKGFIETQESVYEYEGEPQVGRQILLDLGMQEINFGLDEGEPSTNSNDDEGYFYNGERIEEEEYDELKELLKEDSNEPHPFDYKNVSTDMLIRHKKMMIETEAYEEAAKIQEELNSRNVTS